MVFSSEIFLFFFLPMTLLGYYLLNPMYKNVFLLLMSLFFYAWGEPRFVLVLMCSIMVNYFLGILVHKYRDYTCGKILIGIMVVFNLAVFFRYKYIDFVIENINHIAGTEVFALRNIALPIGISFFTFQAMSYVIDVYRGNGKVQYNPLNVGLYITFFPQLIAGPIVRYETVEKEINTRKETVEDFSAGTQRFICGLAKKVILSNNLAAIADYVYSFENYGEINVSLAWLGSLSYMLQIYFDFSGYSDMAIGLGKMFGFHFSENFNYPYIADSVTDFWRRWHISLSTWFRDYVYIPLGGSRGTRFVLYRNLTIVWLLTGIWHGASWNFVFWGIFYLVLLIVEKSTKIHEKAKRHLTTRVLYRTFVLFCVNFAWILFRAPNLASAVRFIKSMFGMTHNTLFDSMALYMWRDSIFLLIISVFFCMPVKGWFERKLAAHPCFLVTVKTILSLLLLVLSVAYISRTSYDPFIYFNF